MYQVLYRKYRPKTFSDVVGQEHITTTLAREVESEKLSHAFLFTGSRGTGKTTCAKILSKAINCLNPKDGNPCGECEICRGIDSGAILDVVEIDAASNNGVDNIREIRDEASFAPVNCKYRVYIIDEVHMLSIGAFNALLKTLEEPPAHVKFILATTEVHKLPVTILSRCQRFDFKRVNAEAMISRMKYIAEQEGFFLQDDAATLIARISDGGMRDALSTLDRCVVREKNVTAQLVSTVAGITGKDHLFALAEAANNSDTAKCVDIINTLHGDSFDMERLCDDLIGHFRNLMISKTVKNCENVLVCTSAEIENYKKQSEKYTLEAILYAIDLLQTSLANMKRGVNRRIEMEMAAIKLSSPKADCDSRALLKRIAALELKLNGANLSVSVAPTENSFSQQETKPMTETKFVEAEQTVSEAEKESGASTAAQDSYPDETADENNDIPFTQWASVLTELMDINKPMWGVLVGSCAYIRNEFVLIKCDNPTFASFIKTGTNARNVKEAIYRVTGQKYRLGIYNASTKPKGETQTVKKDPLSDLISKAENMGVNISID